MSEWSKELDSKSSVLREGHLGFESLSLLHIFRGSPCGEVSELAEGARLEIVCGGTNRHRGFESLPLRHFS